MVDALPAGIEADWTDLGSVLPIPAQADSDRDLIAMWVARSASPATRANATAALKSLFSFAQELGYLRFNVGKVIKAPRSRTPSPSASLMKPPCTGCSPWSRAPAIGRC